MIQEISLVAYLAMGIVLAMIFTYSLWLSFQYLWDTKKRIRGKYIFKALKGAGNEDHTIWPVSRRVK